MTVEEVKAELPYVCTFDRDRTELKDKVIGF
jgi:hypothetical protein